MDLSEILKVIIPLVIMAVWAMNLLFNKEVQAPARPVRPGMPPQEANPQPPPPLPANRGSSYEYAPYSASSSYGETYDDNADLAARRGMSSRDESFPSVLAVDPRALRRPVNSGSASTFGQGPRRNQKTQKPPKKTPPQPKTLSATITSDIGKMGTMGGMVTAPIQFTPLSKQQEATISDSAKAEAKSSIAAQLIRDNVRTPARLREAILVNEILRPPLAMRQGLRLSGGRRGLGIRPESEASNASDHPAS